MITFFLLLWILVPVINAINDKDGHKPNYALVFIIRGSFAIAHGTLMDIVCNIFPPDLYLLNAWELMMVWLPLLVFQVTSFWIVFELLLNWLRGRELFYFDRKELDSGWIDKLFNKLGSGAHLAAKIGCFALMILSIIVIYARN